MEDHKTAADHKKQLETWRQYMVQQVEGLQLLAEHIPREIETVKTQLRDRGCSIESTPPLSPPPPERAAAVPCLPGAAAIMLSKEEQELCQRREHMNKLASAVRYLETQLEAENRKISSQLIAFEKSRCPIQRGQPHPAFSAAVRDEVACRAKFSRLLQQQREQQEQARAKEDVQGKKLSPAREAEQGGPWRVVLSSRERVMAKGESIMKHNREKEQQRQLRAQASALASALDGASAHTQYQAAEKLRLDEKNAASRLKKSEEMTREDAEKEVAQKQPLWDRLASVFSSGGEEKVAAVFHSLQAIRDELKFQRLLDLTHGDPNRFFGLHGKIHVQCPECNFYAVKVGPETPVEMLQYLRRERGGRDDDQFTKLRQLMADPVTLQELEQVAVTSQNSSCHYWPVVDTNACLVCDCLPFDDGNLEARKHGGSPGAYSVIRSALQIYKGAKPPHTLGVGHGSRITMIENFGDIVPA